MECAPPSVTGTVLKSTAWIRQCSALQTTTHIKKQQLEHRYCNACAMLKANISALESIFVFLLFWCLEET